MLPSLLPRVKVRQRIGQVYAEYTKEPPRIYWLWTRAERKLPQSEPITMRGRERKLPQRESIMMARASEERTARMSGEDTPTAEANALRDGAEGLAPRDYSVQGADNADVGDTSMAEANASRGGMTRRSDLAAGQAETLGRSGSAAQIPRRAAAAAQRTWPA